MVKGQAPAISSTSEPRKLKAVSIKGLVSIYAKGYEGRRLSAKIGNDWVVVPALASNFERVTGFTSSGVEVQI